MYCNTPKKQSQELVTQINDYVHARFELASLLVEFEDLYGSGSVDYAENGEVKSQEVNCFLDVDETVLKDEFGKKWTPKKELSILLSESFLRLSQDTRLPLSVRDKFAKRAGHVADCGTMLEFTQYKDIEKPKLTRANFCRSRLCPMCNWRRSMKKCAELSKILDWCDVHHKGVRYLFLTLTFPCVYEDKLIEALDCAIEAWKRFCKYKQFKKSVKGWFRNLEITYSKDNNWFHPHFHVVLAVPPEYFHKSVFYINRDTWLQMWKEACNDFPVLRGDDITQVDIRVIYNKKKEARTASALRLAVLEAGKYAVKFSDYIIEDNPALTDKLVRIFSLALENRRLCDYGGIFKEAYKALGMSEKDDDDLIHTDDTIRGDVAEVYVFHWCPSANRYYNIYRK